MNYQNLTPLASNGSNFLGVILISFRKSKEIRIQIKILDFASTGTPSLAGIFGPEKKKVLL